MQRKELAKLTDYDLVLKLNDHIENIAGDEAEFHADAEEMVQYRQRLSPRIRNKMISIILRSNPLRTDADD